MSKKRIKASDTQSSPLGSTDEEDTLSNDQPSAPISRKGTASSSLSSKKSNEEKDMSSEFEEDANDDDDDEEGSCRSDGSSRHAKSRRSHSFKMKFSFKQAGKKAGKSSKKSGMDDKDACLMDDDAGEESTMEEKPVRKQKRKRQHSDVDYGDSDKKRHSKKAKKARTSDESLECSREADTTAEADDDGMKHDRKRKREETTSDMDYGNMSSQQASESDNSLDSFDSMKKKKKKVRPVIPGERKSSRARKGNTAMRELTDREFEKMLEEEEEESEKKKGKSKKGKKEAGVKTKGKNVGESEKTSRRLNRPEKKDKEDGSGNESDHLWYCELCKDGGDLLLCDTCPKSFHKECLKLDIVPDGEWSCPVCTGEGLPDKAENNTSEEEDHHQTFCRYCKDGGDVILCDFCPLVYHMDCLTPPLKSLPDGEWKCPICIIKASSPKAKVKQVLTWRWKNQPKDADELDHTHSPQKQADAGDGTSKKRPIRNERELFVKYEYHSYWDCAWISEVELEVFQPTTHNNFKRKFDQNEPPALEDGSSFGRPRHKNPSSEDDPHNLEERFYRYGIKPQWLQIHRIITHDGKNKDRRYLVKWRDLPYSECTWEFPEDLPEGLEDFDRFVDVYWARRKQKLAKDEKKVDLPKKSLLRRKLEKQPGYFDECGGSLHPYQLEGLNWLRFSWSQGTNTILADEMGLGKTVQGIAFLYSLYKEGYVTNKPFLVSAPLSTVPNWEREFEFWAPELYVVTYTGGKENRIVIREQEFSYKEGAFVSTTKPCKLREGHKPKFDVLLTSYEYIHNDFATLSSIEWGVLIIDEAHRLKNNQSLFFRTMADYKINYKLLLTGTPLQNNLEELFNLLHFLEPDKFVNMEEFLNEFSEISKDEQVLKLHEMLAPHMLRRMKMDVLKDIPSKCEFIVRIELSPMQKKYYKHILTKNYEALNAKGYSNQTSLINIMMDLRKCCNHPYLFPGAEKDAPLTARGLYEGVNLTKASGKLEMLDKMLRRLKRDGHRVLIFSQMTRMLDILEDFLTAFNYGYERIDGSIAGTKRQECIDRFNSGDTSNFVFLLSTRAGGLGINLATADTVVIYDMDWNPHNDIQAFSRAHRIGQKNKVMIYRFVTRNTVEEKIAQVCKQKMMLSELIVHRGMGGSVQSNERTDSLTKQEISDILKYGAENLFRDDEEGQVVYSDEAIEKLLDRSIEYEGEKEREFGMNEYLRSFKVASYQVKEGVDDDEDEEKDDKDDEISQVASTDDKTESETDIQYWQRILGPAYNEHMIQTLKEQEELANRLGKGKRVRKHINYAEKEMMDAAEALSKARKRVMMEEDLTFQSDYEPSSSSDEGGSGRDEDGSEGSKKKKNQNKGPPPPLPPLVDRVDGQVLVLGFTARQRRAFLDAVMRYGMPPEDPYRSQWLVRDLRGKSERVFKSYVSLFMRHLCEPISDNSDKFADGVPREGLSRQHVLTRIGIIALIRKKVHEFEHINKIDSMAEFKPAKFPEKPSDTDQAVSQASSSAAINKPAEETAPETKKDEVTEPKEEQMDVTQQDKNEEDGNESHKSDQESSSKVPEHSDAVSVQDSKDGEVVTEKVEDVQSNESDKKPKEAEKEDDREVQIISSTPVSSSQTAPTSDSTSANPNPEKNEHTLLTSLQTPAEIAAALRKRFWIADGGFTELHSLWELEEQQLVNKKEYETWHRRHDFWLLTGVITHGYRHWQDILSDSRFDILNQAFRSDSERARKAAFLNRRFQLLEQAMVIEEQLRKAVSENVLGSDHPVSVNSTEPSQALQRLQMIDELAAALRNVNTESKSSKSVKLQKVLNQISALVNDINDMSYINMPASLAKPYAAAVVRNPAPPLMSKIAPMKPMVSPLSGGWSSGLRGSPTPIGLGGIQSSKTSVYGHLSQSGSSRISGQSAAPSSTNKTSKSPNSDKAKDVICID